MVAALEAAQRTYALAGGLAVAVHGAPRATQDVDLLIAPQDLEAVLAVAEGLGYRLRALPMTFPDGMRVQRVTKMAGPEHLTLDLLLAEGALADILAGRERRQASFGPLSVVSRDGLLAMKAAANRPQDLADIARLTEQDR